MCVSPEVAVSRPVAFVRRALVLRVVVGLAPCLLAACGGGSGPSAPEVRVVATLADDGPGSLRQVVADAPAGAIVVFDAALAGGTVPLESPLVLVRPVTIDGGPAGSEITLDGGHATRHVSVVDVDGVVLTRLRLVDGDALTDGGCVYAVGATLRLDHVHLLDAACGGNGGAVYASQCDLELEACHLESHLAERGGALWVAGGRTRVVGCSFLSNTAYAGAGGAMLFGGGDHVVRNSTVHANTSGGAGAAGGGIAAFGGGLTPPVRLGLVGVTVTGNTSSGSGGGVHVGGTSGSDAWVCRQSIVAGNVALTAPDVGIGGAPAITSAWNVVGNLTGGPIWNGLSGNQVGDAFTPLDPVLGAPQPDIEGVFGREPGLGSPVRNVVPHAQTLDELGAPLLFDVWLRPRASDIASDVGAVEGSWP